MMFEDFVYRGIDLVTYAMAPKNAAFNWWEFFQESHQTSVVATVANHNWCEVIEISL